MIDIIECNQGEEEWFEARRGIPTASKFSAILAQGQGKTRKKYLQELAAERISGELTENYSNGYMERGHEWEDLARKEYEFINEVECQKVGFIRNGEKGASPDSLVSDNGLLEVKTRTGQLQIELLLAGKVPNAHIPQIQGQIWVSEREWCDFISYSRGLPPFVRRVYRDDNYINTILWPAVDKFITEMKELEEMIRNV